MVCGRTFYRLAHLVDKSHHMVAEKEMVNYKEFKMEVGGWGGGEESPSSTFYTIHAIKIIKLKTSLTIR